MLSYRSYQNEAHNNIRKAVADGHRRILLVSPTGSGKTRMLSRVVASACRQGKSVAWVAHRRELVDQGVSALEEAGLEVGCYGLRPRALVQAFSVQSVLARGEAPPADLVVLDEAHHYAADEWGQLPATYPEARIIGATATPERGDRRPLDHLFEHMIVMAQPSELVALRYLCPVETHRPPRVQPKGKLARWPEEAYVMAGLRGAPAIVFAPNVRQAEAFADRFRATGIRCHVVTGDLPQDVRAKRLAEFRDGSVHVLINVYVLTEGFDHPPTECVILARHFGTAGQYMQCAGRGLRLYPGKSKLIFIDLVGASYIHGDPLEDRVYSLDGEGMRRKGPDPIAFCRVCGNLAEQCECGIGAKQIVMLESTNDPLIKFARIRRDSDDERANRLARWIVEARKRKDGTGNWKAALFRYKGAYGVPASGDIVSRALAIEAGRRWCPDCKTSKCEHAKGAA